MRSDCCSPEVSFSLWLKRTYYSFWDVVNRKKWLRPLYNLHYRILCWRGQDDFEDTPGLYDEDCPFNPEKFIEQECRNRTDREIPYPYYQQFLGHELTAKEREELERRRLVCLENRRKAAGCCCFATSGTFKQEADYITSILEK